MNKCQIKNGSYSCMNCDGYECQRYKAYQQGRADAIEEFVKGCKATHDGLICNWDKPYGITFERMEEKAKQLREQK